MCTACDRSATAGPMSQRRSSQSARTCTKRNFRLT